MKTFCFSQKEVHLLKNSLLAMKQSYETSHILLDGKSLVISKKLEQIAELLARLEEE